MSSLSTLKNNQEPKSCTRSSGHFTGCGRLHRGHSMTMHHPVDDPTSRLDHEPAISSDDDETSLDDLIRDAHRRPRSRILIENPTSERVLDMELPSPPRIASRKQLYSLAPKESKIESNVLGRRNSVSALKKALPAEVLISDAMQPPRRPPTYNRTGSLRYLLSEPTKHALSERESEGQKQQSHRRLERRNCITKFNIDSSEQCTEDDDQEYERLLMGRQTQSVWRDRTCVYDANVIETPRSKILHQDRMLRLAKQDRRTVCGGEKPVTSLMHGSRSKENISTAQDSTPPSNEALQKFPGVRNRQGSNLCTSPTPRKPSSMRSVRVPCTPARLLRSRSNRAINSSDNDEWEAEKKAGEEIGNTNVIGSLRKSLTKSWSARSVNSRAA
jgi:hypothetical protein